MKKRIYISHIIQDSRENNQTLTSNIIKLTFFLARLTQNLLSNQTNLLYILTNQELMSRPQIKL